MHPAGTVSALEIQSYTKVSMGMQSTTGRANAADAAGSILSPRACFPQVARSVFTISEWALGRADRQAGKQPLSDILRVIWDRIGMEVENTDSLRKASLPGTHSFPLCASCCALLHPKRTLGLLSFLLLFSPAFATAQSSGSGQVNCTDPLYSSTAACRGASDDPTQTSVAVPRTTQDNTADSTGGAQRSSDNQQVYIDQGGTDPRPRTASSNQPERLFPPDPVTDFQRLVRSSTGEMLPIFGRDLFQQAPSTFAPANQIPVTADYIVGPGDEVLVRLWGPESFNSQLTVDTTGSIYIPKVGAIHVAGLRSDELQKQISTEVNHIFRNYRISVSLGQLRSIQIYVVGEARRPGAYTISALSTVLNALFVSGGPDVQGSLRHIQIRHEGKPPSDFDLYDLVLRGDKTKDIRLEQGDTIFIPAAGPQVAIAGSVRHPAIYEILNETTAPDLLELAGGYTSTARRNTVSLERIDPALDRQVFTVTLDAADRAMTLRDGDVLFVNHITQGYEKSVTIRGNLANPGRFAWHDGMRLSEIIPDRMSLLTSNYWRERNRLGVPTPLFEPQPQNLFPQVPANGSRTRTYPQNNASPSNYVTNPQYPGQASADTYNNYNNATLSPDDQALQNTADAFALQSSSQQATTPQPTAATLFAQNTQNSNANIPSTGAHQENNFGEPGVSETGPDVSRPDIRNDRVANRIQIPAPEIDWSYAVIERLDAKTLKSVLLPFNLGDLVDNGNPAQNLELQPGDIVTILSQADIPVSIDEQTKFVRLEGEFVSAGVYSVRPGEDLEALVMRAGGLTAKAYLYGSSFLRESARVFQQQRLNEYISSLSADMERSAAERAASSSTGILDPNALAEQRSLVAQLRQLRATGRVVLEFRPTSVGVGSIPKIPLENGDIFRIPSRPSTVSVVGAVYGQNVFLFDSSRHVSDYVDLAGKPNRIADRQHAFIIRADGSVFSRERTQGVLSNRFDSTAIYPGDAIVIPEKLIKPSALRNVLDYSQILSSFGLAAAAINVVR